MLIASAPPPSRPERVIVATAPNDFHVFSPLLLTYLLRRRGWDVIYLGADVPADELESTIALVKPGLVIISASYYIQPPISHLARSLTNQEAALAFGGLIFNHNPSMRRVIPGHFLGQTIEEAVQNAAGPAFNAIFPNACVSARQKMPVHVESFHGKQIVD